MSASRVVPLALVLTLTFALTTPSTASISFIRGDANDDGLVSGSLDAMWDGLFILQWLFTGGAAPACPDAADATDDGLTNISDAAYLLQYGWMGGPPPPAPWPACGGSPSASCLSAYCP